MLTIQQMIASRMLVTETTDQDLQRDGFISYIVPDDKVILVANQTDGHWMRVTYVQLVDDGEQQVWVVQLEGAPEQPNNYGVNDYVDYQLFKRISH